MRLNSLNEFLKNHYMNEIRELRCFSLFPLSISVYTHTPLRSKSDIFLMYYYNENDAKVHF